MPLSPSSDVEVVLTRPAVSVEPRLKRSPSLQQDSHLPHRYCSTTTHPIHRHGERRRRPQCSCARRSATRRQSRDLSTDYGSSSPLHTISLPLQQQVVASEFDPQQEQQEQWQDTSEPVEFQTSSHTHPSSAPAHSFDSTHSHLFDLPESIEPFTHRSHDLREPELAFLGDSRDFESLFAMSTMPHLNVQRTVQPQRDYDYNLTFNRTSRRQQRQRSSLQHVVDLTQDESPRLQASENTQRGKRKRDREDKSPSQPSSSKRLKSSTGAAINSTGAPSTYIPDLSQDIEEIDLVGQDDGAYEATLSRQRKEQVTAQQQAATARGESQSKLWEISCAICMDTPTDMTGTSCGHYFCWSCLNNWLASTEREGFRRSNCPSCRKTISRHKNNEVIPLLFMKGTATS